MCDVGLPWALYVLLVPVRKDIALLAVFFRLVSTATFGFAELFYFLTALILGGAGYLKTFSPDQVNSLALLSFKVYGYGGGIFMVFYGVASILLGYLIFQSEYLPKFLGILLALGGVGFVIRNFALVLAPAYASDVFLLPAMIAMLALILWFLIRGINVRKWEEKRRLLTQPCESLRPIKSSLRPSTLNPAFWRSCLPGRVCEWPLSPRATVSLR
jgi:hypothetical protein